jgi:hypothetical protein
VVSTRSGTMAGRLQTFRDHFRPCLRKRLKDRRCTLFMTSLTTLMPPRYTTQIMDLKFAMETIRAHFRPFATFCPTNCCVIIPHQICIMICDPCYTVSCGGWHSYPSRNKLKAASKLFKTQRLAYPRERCMPLSKRHVVSSRAV